MLYGRAHCSWNSHVLAQVWRSRETRDTGGGQGKAEEKGCSLCTSQGPRVFLPNIGTLEFSSQQIFSKRKEKMDYEILSEQVQSCSLLSTVKIFCLERKREHSALPRESQGSTGICITFVKTAFAADILGPCRTSSSLPCPPSPSRSSKSLLPWAIFLSNLINIWTHSGLLKTGNQFERQDKYYLLSSHLLWYVNTSAFSSDTGLLI